MAIGYYLIVALFIINGINVSSSLSSLADFSRFGRGCNCIDLIDCPKILNIFIIMHTKLRQRDFNVFMRRVICDQAPFHTKVCCAYNVELEERMLGISSGSGAVQVNRGCGCVSIMECPKILEIFDFMHGKGFYREFNAFKRRVICGFAMAKPMVCCGFNVEAERRIMDSSSSTEIMGIDTNCQCIKVVDCPKIHKILGIMNSRGMNNEYNDFMSRVICAVQDKDIKVCCNYNVEAEEKMIPSTSSLEIPEVDITNCDCMMLRECPGMLDIFDMVVKRRLTNEFFPVKRKMICEIDGNRPKVCCKLGLELSYKMIAGDKCYGPDGEPGKCVDIYDCEIMLDIITRKPLSQKYRQLLRSARCGSIGKRPKVCCYSEPWSVPEDEPDFEPREGLALVASLSRHPSLKYLPHDICGPVKEARIFGGDNTTVYENPWMALLGYSERNKDINFACAGSLINEKYVLTAAHCLMGLPSGTKLSKVRIGEYDLATEKDCDYLGSCIGKYQDFDIEYTRPHKLYTKETSQNDIGLIRLQGIVDFEPPNIRPICLPLHPETSAEINSLPAKAVVAGWGTTESGRTSNRLLKVRLPLLSIEFCKKNYAHRMNVELSSEKQICAGGVKGQDTCSGDSGGPLHAIASYGLRPSTVQYGIVSYGPARCGMSGYAGVYTRVSYYIDWILDNIESTEPEEMINFDI